jgi:cell wall-associated NlpC family hydrolase
VSRATVEVNDLIGKPWRLGARGPDAFDCWGLTREILGRLRPGKPLPDWASDGMSRERQRALIGGELPAWCKPATALDHGTLLYSERATHIAIVVDGWAITAVRHGGVVAMKAANYAAMFLDLRAYTWRG